MIKDEYELLKLGQNVQFTREVTREGVHLYAFNYGGGFYVSLAIRYLGGVWVGSRNENEFKFGLTAWGVIRAILIDALQVQHTLQYAQTNQVSLDKAFKVWTAIGRNWDALHGNNGSAV